MFVVTRRPIHLCFSVSEWCDKLRSVCAGAHAVELAVVGEPRAAAVASCAHHAAERAPHLQRDQRAHRSGAAAHPAQPYATAAGKRSHLIAICFRLDLVRETSTFTSLWLLPHLRCTPACHCAHPAAGQCHAWSFCSVITQTGACCCRRRPWSASQQLQPPAPARRQRRRSISRRSACSDATWRTRRCRRRPGRQLHRSQQMTTSQQPHRRLFLPGCLTFSIFTSIAMSCRSPPAGSQHPFEH